MSELIEQLQSFNRKERFILLHRALGPEAFHLDEGFRQRLGQELKLTIPDSAFVAIDYHLDWLQMALHFTETPWDGQPIETPNGFEANQRDVDLLIAFDADATTHIVLLEAKVDTSWTNAQLRPKVARLRQIFGEHPRADLATPHFVLLSPKRPTRVDSDRWPDWMKPEREPQWMSLARPDLRKVTRCTADGEASEAGGFLRVDTRSSWPRLDRLATFLPVFEGSRFVFATMEGGDEIEPGTITMPWSALSEHAHRFVETAYEDGWVSPEVDWSEWMQTAEAIRLRDDPDALPQATVEQLQKLLTTVIRQDRFVTGALAEAFESGLLTAIVRRMAQLRLAPPTEGVDV